MDPLTLLRELFGEEPIRKIVSSGFDSVHKIAATTPESLSFFSGINEAMARQIVSSAEESIAGPPAAAYRGALAGSAEPEPAEPAVPVKPRVPPASRAPAARKAKREFDPLDDDPIYDAAGIMKGVAQEPRPKDLMEADDFLDEVGLSDAEAEFLEGISPWPGGTPRREKTFPASLESSHDSGPFSRREEKEVEYAPISDWSPEKDPDPVPRLVPAFGTEPEEPEEPTAAQGDETEVIVSLSSAFGQPEPAPRPTEFGTPSEGDVRPPVFDTAFNALPDPAASESAPTENRSSPHLETPVDGPGESELPAVSQAASAAITEPSSSSAALAGAGDQPAVEPGFAPTARTRKAESASPGIEKPSAEGDETGDPSFWSFGK
jgi:hypothetical protein